MNEGFITSSLPNGMFRVRLDNEDLIRCYVSGRIRRSFIRILPGDRVKMEVSRYDSTRGHIIYRFRNKDSTDVVVFLLQHSGKSQETYFLPRNRFRKKEKSGA